LILGRSQISVTSTLTMTPPLGADQIGGVDQELVGRRALPLRIGRREVVADIAFTDRAQHGVGQGVQAGVGVGVADQGLVMGDLDAAQPDGFAGVPSGGRRSPGPCG
jgi:hypothetical protein